MKHLSDAQLILFHYHEGEDELGVQEHLGFCDVCHDRYQKLQRLFSAVDATPVPIRAEHYGAAVWQQLRSRLDERPRFDWRRWLQSLRPPALPRWAWAPAKRESGMCWRL